MEIVMTGKSVANSVGVNGPVRIYGTSVTSINARKRMMMEATGVSAQPATARCRTAEPDQQHRRRLADGSQYRMVACQRCATSDGSDHGANHGPARREWIGYAGCRNGQGRKSAVPEGLSAIRYFVVAVFHSCSTSLQRPKRC